MVCTKKIETMPDVESWTSSTPITSNSFYLTNAAYGNGVFIAFSQTSDMLFSQDGINWSLTTAPFTNAIITSFCNGMFVIARATGTLSTSTDGVNWTTPVSTNLSYSSASGDFIDIIFNGTQYVAISVNGYISTSTDLVTWSTYTQNSNLGSNGWEKVLQRGNEFIALSRSKVSKSSDGINWSAAQSYVGMTQGIAFALGYKNKIVAVDSSSVKKFYESTDGINWVSYTLPNFSVASIIKIVFGDNIYAILHTDSNYKASNLYTNTKTASVVKKYALTLLDGLISSAGTSWVDPVQYNNLGSHSWNDIAFGNNKYVAIGNDGYISISTDGKNWSVATQNTNLGSRTWSAIAYGNGTFVALGYSGYISTSTDGVNWTSAVQNSSLGTKEWRGLTYDGTRFVALGSSSGKPTIGLSTSGTTWGRSTPTSVSDSGGWNDITYGNGVYVIVSRNYKVSKSSDLRTWNPVVSITPTVNDNNYCLAYGNGEFIAFSAYGYVSTSTIGSTWSTATQYSNLNINYPSWRGVIFDGTKFVAISSVGHITNDATVKNIKTYTLATKKNGITKRYV